MYGDLASRKKALEWQMVMFWDFWIFPQLLQAGGDGSGGEGDSPIHYWIFYVLYVFFTEKVATKILGSCRNCLKCFLVTTKIIQ